MLNWIMVLVLLGYVLMASALGRYLLISQEIDWNEESNIVGKSINAFIFFFVLRVHKLGPIELRTWWLKPSVTELPRVEQCTHFKKKCAGSAMHGYPKCAYCLTTCVTYILTN